VQLDYSDNTVPAPSAAESSRPTHENAPPCSANVSAPLHEHAHLTLTGHPQPFNGVPHHNSPHRREAQWNSRLRTYAHRPHSRTAATHYEPTQTASSLHLQNTSRGLCAHYEVSASKPGSQNAQTAHHMKNTTPCKAYGTALLQEHIYSTRTLHTVFLLSTSSLWHNAGDGSCTHYEISARKTEDSQHSRLLYENRTPHTMITTPRQHTTAPLHEHAHRHDWALCDHEALTRRLYSRTARITGYDTPCEHIPGSIYILFRDGTVHLLHYVHSIYHPAPTHASTPAHSLSGHVVGYSSCMCHCAHMLISSTA